MYTTLSWPLGYHSVETVYNVHHIIMVTGVSQCRNSVETVYNVHHLIMVTGVSQCRNSVQCTPPYHGHWGITVWKQCTMYATLSWSLGYHSVETVYNVHHLIMVTGVSQCRNSVQCTPPYPVHWGITVWKQCTMYTTLSWSLGYHSVETVYNVNHLILSTGVSQCRNSVQCTPPYPGHLGITV